jgi:hypothetical protein
MYRLACEGIASDETLPRKVKLHDMGDCRISIGKNAGWVELRYNYVNTAGQTVPGARVVWLKRVARTWTVDRITPVPKPSESE